MPVRKKEHRGRPNYVQYPQALSSRSSSVSSRSSSSYRKRWNDRFEGDRFVPRGSPFCGLPKNNPHKSVKPEPLIEKLPPYEDSKPRSGLTSFSSSARGYSSEEEIEDYLELLYRNIGAQDRLS